MTIDEIKAHQKETTNVNTKKTKSYDTFVVLEPLTIETDYVIYYIPEGTEIIDNLEAVTDYFYRSIEKVTGLKYRDKVKIEIVDNDSAYYSPYENKITMSKKIIFAKTIDFTALMHESIHAIQPLDKNFINSTSFAYCFYAEGFADYYLYKLNEYIKDTEYTNLLYLENYSFFMVEDMESLGQNVGGNIYDKNIEVWIKYSSEDGFYPTNVRYLLGPYFFAYLDDVYGDANSWIDKYTFNLQTMKDTYGEDVFDNFYPWLKQHENMLQINK